MLLAQTTYLSPPLQFSFTKYSRRNTKIPFSGLSEKNKKLKSRESGKLGVLFNGYTYFTSPLHPLESELPFPVDSVTDNDGGIGIDKFYEGKNIFITGATGLLGKVLVEKLLRSTSVGKIYVLVNASDKEVALDRLSKEIIGSDLFESLREKHGISYQEFVGTKLIPVVGNICAPNIGMDALSSSTQTIMEEVDVIIGSAACTTLNDRYDFLLDLNVNAPQRLMRFAKRCKKLKLFVHISTAYVNGLREGIIHEKALIMGENGRGDLFPLDLTDEMNIAIKSCIASTTQDATKDLKRLGLERAAYHGWYNAYHMTKAMAEMALNEMREDVPVLILRPAIIESCYKEPIPGWIQGNRMYDPVMISYGKGQLPAYLADPNLHTDIVPVDMVVNTAIAAIAKHGISRNPQLNVYHVATDFVNPLRFSDMFDYIYEHFSANPLSDGSESMRKMKLFDEFSDFSKYVRDALIVSEPNGIRTLQNVQKLYKAKVAYAEQLCKMYEFIGFFKARISMYMEKYEEY
ncbi:hypothetical protein ACS0TY_023311 [Phlomoides rotata]